LQHSAELLCYVNGSIGASTVGDDDLKWFKAGD
jgi:hypothetical protein